MPLYSLNWLADVARDAGLTVNEVSGWQRRGHAEFLSPLGVIGHHTAGATPSHGPMPSLSTVEFGRKGLPGPLCNYALGRDGVVHTVAAGLAYHAGTGIFRGVRAGNSHFIGIEAENTGYIHGPTAEQPWNPVQMNAYAKLCAAILDHIHQPVEWCIGHKEWAPRRKVDPTFDMALFRKSVASYMPKPLGTVKGRVKSWVGKFTVPSRYDLFDACTEHAQ